MKETMKEKSEKKTLVLEVFDELSLIEKMEVLRLMLTPELQKQIEREFEARSILEEAGQLTQKRIQEGWTDEDFKKDFFKVQREIAHLLSRQE